MKGSRLKATLLELPFCSLVIATSLVINPSTLNQFSVEAGHNLFDIANRHSKGTQIVCLGDSLTYGVGASAGHDYPSFLGKALGMKVLNAGVDGDETGDVLKRLDSDVLLRDPRLVIILLGANDYLNRKPIEIGRAHV